MPEIDGFELAEHDPPASPFPEDRHHLYFRSPPHRPGSIERLRARSSRLYFRSRHSRIAARQGQRICRTHRKALQLEQPNRELEQRVAERTQELENKAEALELLNLQLNQKNDQLDAILQTAPDIIFSSRGDGSRDFLSASFFEYTGATPESAMGFGWMNYVHSEDREKIKTHWAQCIQDRQNYEASTAFGKNRRVSLVSGSCRSSSRSELQSSRWYGTCSDIHDSKLLEQSIRENSTTLEKLVEETNRSSTASLQPLDADAGRGATPDCPRTSR